MHSAAWGQLVLIRVLTNQFHHVWPEVSADRNAFGAAGITPSWMARLLLASASHQGHTKDEV